MTHSLKDKNLLELKEDVKKTKPTDYELISQTQNKEQETDIWYRKLDEILKKR